MLVKPCKFMSSFYYFDFNCKNADLVVGGT